MRQNRLGLGPFLEQLEQRLAARSGEELRGILLDHAARLPAAERAGFLAVFAKPSRGAGVEADDELVGAVEEFVADVEKGVYVEGWGYDPEYRDHRAFGDETWTIEFDDLAERAGQALLAGDAVTARGAYRGLFEVLSGEHGEGGLPGAGTPEELVGTDVGEAKHRYLRAVWESEPVPTRAAAVVAAVDEVAYVRGPASLAALEATRREPLPDLDAVLPDLIARLREVPAGYGFGTQARGLLGEATERHGGVDGLAVLARAPGAGQAEAYRDWVDALARAGRLDDARAAAAEALERVDAHAPVLAAVAQRLAVLAAAFGDDDAVLAARLAGWRAAPTVSSLLDLVDVATALDRRVEVIAAEADRAFEGPLEQRDALRAALFLLTGRVDAAVELLASAEPCWWDPYRDPAVVVVPFLLVGASGAHRDERWEQSLLFELLDRANSAGWRYGGYHPEADEGLDALRRAVSASPESAPAERYHAIPRDRLLVSALLTEVPENSPVPRDEQQRWLSTARHQVDARVDAVVTGQHRSAYPQVAHLAAACAEAVMLADDPATTHPYLDDLHARYPRHTAFRRELRTFAAQSPLLDS